MFLTVIGPYRLNTLYKSVSGHSDIVVDQWIQFYLNNAINHRPLTADIMSCYTHKMAIVF